MIVRGKTVKEPAGSEPCEKMSNKKLSAKYSFYLTPEITITHTWQIHGMECAAHLWRQFSSGVRRQAALPSRFHSDTTGRK